MNYTNTYLQHHGVKGMKWGVRRYQNEDGTLTADGKKRISKMSDDKIRKLIRKDVKRSRIKQFGYGSQWDTSRTIGKNSKKARDEYWDAVRKYHDEKYDQYNEKFENLEKQYDLGKIDVEELDEKWVSLQKEIYNPELDNSVALTSDGRKYSREYLNKYGSRINIGYIKDLGFNEQTARYLNSRIMKSKIKTID